MNKNMLQIDAVNRFVKSRSFPLVFQILNMAMIVFLIVSGWGITDESFRYTSITSFVVWVLWWPGIIFMGLFAARFWCTVCHLRLLAKYTGKVGFQFRVPPSVTRYGATVTVLIALGMFFLHSTVESYEVDHIAHLTAQYLTILIAFAVLVSFFFREGTFCKSLCPLVGFLGPYAKLSPTELRASNRALCLKCTSKACQKQCSNNLYMGNLDNNEGCLLCFDCVKACPEDNIRFSFRPFLYDLWNARRKSAASALVVVLLLGIIFEEVGEEWDVVHRALTFVPSVIVQYAGLPERILGHYHWLESLWVNILFPLLVVSVAALFSRPVTGKISALQYGKTYSIGLIPLLFSVHVAKHWHTFNSKFGYIEQVTSNVSANLTTSRMVTEFKPASTFMPSSTEGMFMLAMVLAGTISSLFVIHKLSQKAFDMPRRHRLQSAVPFYLLTSMIGTVFLLTMYHWLLA